MLHLVSIPEFSKVWIISPFYFQAIVIKEMILRAAKKQFKGCMQSSELRNFKCCQYFP